MDFFFLRNTGLDLRIGASLSQQLNDTAKGYPLSPGTSGHCHAHSGVQNPSNKGGENTLSKNTAMLQSHSGFQKRTKMIDSAEEGS